MNRLLTVFGICLAICFCCDCSPSPASVAKNPPPPELEPTDVYLLPLDDFDYRTADQLARILRQELKLRVRATVNVGSGGVEKINNGAQYSAESLLKIGGQAAASLSEKSGKTIFVVLTAHDINSVEGSLRFLFSLNNRGEKIAVLSTARLAIGIENNAAGMDLFGRRCVKMIKRQVGELYYGYPRSTDISDVMFAPIMSLETIDKMGSEFKAQPETEKKRVENLKEARNSVGVFDFYVGA